MVNMKHTNNKFIARYTENGINKSIFFNRDRYNKKKAAIWLKDHGIKNFFFFFEPEPPQEFGENGIMLKGEVGFDITAEMIFKFIDQGKEIILDSYGGDLFESWKIYDAIKIKNQNPKIGVIGMCASAAMQILLATEDRWMSENSKTLIHNPWSFEAGDDEELKAKARQLEKEKLNLAKLYSDVSGKTIDEILIVMKEERFMDREEAELFNFVKPEPTTKETVKIDDNTNVNNEAMKINNEEKKELNGIKALIDKLFNKLNPVKNIVVQDVNGVEIDFGDEVETVEQISVGDTATVDGENATGEYTMQSGEIYVFENGELTEIREPESATEDDEEMEALKTENESLKTELEELKTETQNRLQETEKINNELSEVKTKFEEFQNKFTDEESTPVKPPAETKGQSAFSYKRN